VCVIISSRRDHNYLISFPQLLTLLSCSSVFVRNIDTSQIISIMGARIARVRKQHQDIAVLATEIQKHAQQIVQTAANAGYDPANPTTCQRMVLSYRNALNQFNKSTLVQVAYNVGLAPTSDELKDVNKQQICDIILEYYRRKTDIVAFVQNELDGTCRESERQISANMEQMLEGSARNVQDLAYQRLIALNKAIQTLYEHADSILEFVMREDVPPETLDQYIPQAFQQLQIDKVECCRRAHALRQFAWFPVVGAGAAAGGGGRAGAGAGVNVQNIQYRNTYTNEIVPRLPRVSRIEAEFPAAQIPCA